MGSFSIWHWFFLLIIVGVVAYRALRQKKAASVTSQLITSSQPHFTNKGTEMSETGSTASISDMSPTSIGFWRHIIGMAIVLTILPPYALGNLPEFMGFSFGKFLSAIIPAAIITFLSGLFLTNIMKGRVWRVFVISAWAFGFIGLYFINKGIES